MTQTNRCIPFYTLPPKFSNLGKWSSTPTRRDARAFTLIELLVVIAIVAILMTLLLPALHRARLEAWKVVSMANLHSICEASAAYQHDQKGYFPIVLPRAVNSDGSDPGWTERPFAMVEMQCGWSGWGKNCDVSWSTSSGSGSRNPWFDVPAAYRPLNPYLTSLSIEKPRRGQATLNKAPRKIFQLPICKDPSQRNIGYQQHAYTQYYEGLPNDNPTISCYDDVGTSYLWQKWWLQYMVWNFGNNNVYSPSVTAKCLRLGNERFRDSSGVQPSYMIWCTDEWSEASMRPMHDEDVLNHKSRQIRNGYGDINKGVVGYLDGHVRYVPHRKVNKVSMGNGASNPFITKEYTAVFLDWVSN